MDTGKRRELESIFRKILGEQIRSKRLALGLTQDQAAADIGCSTKHLGRLERGEKTPSSFMLALVQLQLGIETQDYLPALEKAMIQMELDE